MSVTHQVASIPSFSVLTQQVLYRPVLAVFGRLAQTHHNVPDLRPNSLFQTCIHMDGVLHC